LGNNKKEVKEMAKKSYSWFEKRRKTKALDLAQQQITKAP
jgi:hypothetical protein